MTEMVSAAVFPASRAASRIGDHRYLRRRTQLASVHILNHALAQRADRNRTHRQLLSWMRLTTPRSSRQDRWATQGRKRTCPAGRGLRDDLRFHLQGRPTGRSVMALSILDGISRRSRSARAAAFVPARERHARFAFMENEHWPCTLTNDEVTLPVTALGSGVDFLGPFVDGDAVTFTVASGSPRF